MRQILPMLESVNYCMRHILVVQLAYLSRVRSRCAMEELQARNINDI